VDVFTGIARFVFEQGMLVQMYSFNSLGQNISMGRVTNGQIVYWYDFAGNAPTRRFVLSNPMKFPASFRITVQRLESMLIDGSLQLRIAGALFVVTLLSMVV
jgi:hypothetical protein